MYWQTIHIITNEIPYNDDVSGLSFLEVNTIYINPILKDKEYEIFPIITMLLLLSLVLLLFIHIICNYIKYCKRK